MTQLEDDSQDLMGYEALVQEAMQGVMRKVLLRVSQTGFPAKRHLYIVFKTDFPGVVLSERLLAKCPEEMTIVLQNQFWDLTVIDSGFFVSLSFSGKKERLYVPFLAIKTFFDPAVSFGLQFKVEGALDEDGMDLFENLVEAEREKAQTAAVLSLEGGLDASVDREEKEPGAENANVLDLNAFRRRRDF